MQDTKVLPKSYHIFLFPFKWDFLKTNDVSKLSFDEKVDIRKFIEFLNINNEWKYNKVNIDNDKTFNEYYFFYDHVRDAIYSKEDEFNKDFYKQTVYNYTYSKLKNKQGKYIINILKDKKEYKLDLEKIELKVYATGVGILSFHIANNQYEDINDILNINDYGRRIYPQFLPVNATKGSFLANKITLEIGDEKIEEDFSHYENSYELNLSDTIMKLLGDKFKDNKSKLNSGDIYIKPIIDDRMFTICWFGHKEKDEDIYKLYNYNEDRYGYVNNELWHRYIFVDTDYSSCQSQELLKELLTKHTYDRWIEYKTLYGITRYSFMELTEAGGFSNHLLTHIKTMYYQMVCLILAQRASVLRFSDEATHIATLNEIDENNDIYDTQVVQKVRSLYKQYIQFINKMHFREVSPQEQGIELYNKLIFATGVKEEIKNLDEELDELHRYSTMIESKQNLVQDKKIGKIINLITFLGVPLAWSQVAIALFGLNFSWDRNNLLKLGTILGLPSILFVVLCLIFINYNKPKNR